MTAIQCERTDREADTLEEGLRESHAREADKHAGQRNTHERIKRHHHELMARMRLAIDTLTKAF